MINELLPNRPCGVRKAWGHGSLGCVNPRTGVVLTRHSLEPCGFEEPNVESRTTNLVQLCELE